MNRPLLLLLGSGIAFGANFPLGKLAMAAGINPALWAVVICAGAGTMMLLLSLARDRGPQPPVLRYAATSGFLSYVVPHFLTFLTIPHIGSGLASILVATSPVTTAILSLILKVRPPSALALAGIAAGLAGAVTIVVGRNAGMAAGDGRWLLLAALIPVFLGFGNVYRSLGWPAGAAPTRLAALTNLAAVPPLLAVGWLWAGNLDVAPLVAAPGLGLAQVTASTIMFVMLFRLQQLSGPTYLSQIGYVAAVIGVGVGVAFLGETYPASVWAGTAVVAVGIALSTAAQLRAAKA